MNVVISGGTGFVGSWMRKKQPMGIDSLVLSKNGYSSTWEQFNYTHVVHLANIEPTRAIACARRNNARLLYCSSGIVGYPEVNTEYANNKRMWERECLQSGVDVVIARLYTFFGAGLDENKAIENLFKLARLGKPLTVYGQPSYETPATVRSYMWAGRMGKMMWSILLKGESGKAYSVGSTRPTSIFRLAKRIQAFTGCEIEFVDKPVPVPRYLPKI